MPKSYFGPHPWVQYCGFPDLMSWLLPSGHLHTEVLAALHAGAHVITEKPMCLDIHEADQIIEIERKANRLSP